MAEEITESQNTDYDPLKSGRNGPLKGVIGVPTWLKQRREKLKKRPPATVEEVIAQWKASIEQFSGNPYKDQDVIR